MASGVKLRSCVCLAGAIVSGRFQLLNWVLWCRGKPWQGWMCAECGTNKGQGSERQSSTSGYGVRASVLWKVTPPHTETQRRRTSTLFGGRKRKWVQKKSNGKDSLDGSRLLACLFREVWEPTALTSWERKGKVALYTDIFISWSCNFKNIF